MFAAKDVKLRWGHLRGTNNVTQEAFNKLFLLDFVIQGFLQLFYELLVLQEPPSLGNIPEILPDPKVLILELQMRISEFIDDAFF